METTNLYKEKKRTFIKFSCVLASKEAFINSRELTFYSLFL